MPAASPARKTEPLAPPGWMQNLSNLAFPKKTGWLRAAHHKGLKSYGPMLLFDKEINISTEPSRRLLQRSPYRSAPCSIINPVGNAPMFYVMTEQDSRHFGGFSPQGRRCSHYRRGKR